jgi:hypothetical protein
MPNMPPPEVQQWDVVVVNKERIATLTSSGKLYKARVLWPEEQPLKEKDILIITKRAATSVSVNRFINGKLDDLAYLLIFDVN